MLTCNSDIIDAFFAGRLSASEQEDFERHLEECESCCTALQSRSADARLWDDARNYLSSIQLDATTSSTRDDTGGFDLRNLDFLAATDDPHMLGRFAGYEISGVIGCGGMGIVLKGFDSALNRYVAIKVLAPHYASSGAARQRFAREAQAAAAVVHDNVIAIHGVDEFNSLPYLIMPYVKGESLQKRIQREGGLSVSEILRIALQTARGLAAAHDQGLVHRDIKPGNILLPENVERVVITDFGLARAADDASLTRSGVIAGTPQFMSPEQARGEGIDHRSDLFSLGSVMYAMCTGHPPFRAETPYGILRRITDNEPRPIQELNPAVPRWLCGVVGRLLCKNAAGRFCNATEVADLLEDCLAHVQQPTKVSLPETVQSRNTRLAVPQWLVWLVWLLPLLLLAGWQIMRSMNLSVADHDQPQNTMSAPEVNRAERSEPRQITTSNNAATQTTATHNAVASGPAGVRAAQTGRQEPATPEADFDWLGTESDLDNLESTLNSLDKELNGP